MPGFNFKFNKCKVKGGRDADAREGSIGSQNESRFAMLDGLSKHSSPGDSSNSEDEE